MSGRIPGGKKWDLVFDEDDLWLKVNDVNRGQFALLASAGHLLQVCLKVRVSWRKCEWKWSIFLFALRGQTPRPLH